MSMPLPVLIAFVAMLGWPMVQIASVLLARSRRRRLKEIAGELCRDDRLGPADRALIDRTMRESRGDPGFIVFPLVLPLAILAAAIAELVGRNPPSETSTSHGRSIRRDLTRLEVELGMRSGDEIVDRDPRYRTLRDLAFEIGVLRWPISAVLTILLCLPVLPVYGLACGARRMMTIIPEATASLWRTLRLSMLGISELHR